MQKVRPNVDRAEWGWGVAHGRALNEVRSLYPELSGAPVIGSRISILLWVYNTSKAVLHVRNSGLIEMRQGRAVVVVAAVVPKPIAHGFQRLRLVRFLEWFCTSNRGLPTKTTVH